MCLFARIAGVMEATAGTDPASTSTDGFQLELPGHPFGVVVSGDGRWVFVAVMSEKAGASGVAVIQQDQGRYELKRVVPCEGAAELALTHDGKILVVAAGDSVGLLDTGRMISGTGDPHMGAFSDGAGAGSIYVNVTRDDKVLFVSDEGAEAITVIDLDRVRSSGYDARAVIGKIPVGRAPIALTFSPDDRLLYTTSEIAAEAWEWPKTVKSENSDPGLPSPMVQEGAVVVIDVAQAKADPAHSVLTRVPAGGSPVRMVMSPDGRLIYVTARGSNAVLVFDAAKLVTDPGHARLAKVPVVVSPVPLAIIQNGRTLVVGNSNRFGSDAGAFQKLSVLDIARMGRDDAVTGTIKAGIFPREMCISADGKTLFLTNFNSDSLQVIDAQNPPIEPRQ